MARKFVGLPESTKASAAALIAANAIPLAGTVFFAWDYKSVLIAYWAENAVVGVYNILKILVCNDSLSARLISAPLFVVLYTAFMLGHLAFVLFVTGFGFLYSIADGSAFGEPVLFLVASFASHGISFAANYLPRERENARAFKLAFLPYYRLFAMQFVVIVGFAMAGFARGAGLSVIAGAALIAFLVLVKTVFDLAAHLNERASLELLPPEEFFAPLINPLPKPLREIAKKFFEA